MGPITHFVVSTVSSLAVGTVIGNVARATLPLGAGKIARAWVAFGAMAIGSTVASKCGESFADEVSLLVDFAKEQGETVQDIMNERKMNAAADKD